MPDRNETQIAYDPTKVVTQTVAKWGVYTVVMSTNDTVTLDNFTTIDQALITRKDTGATMTFTRSGKQLTLTQAGITNVEMMVFAYEV